MTSSHLITIEEVIQYLVRRDSISYGEAKYKVQQTQFDIIKRLEGGADLEDILAILLSSLNLTEDFLAAFILPSEKFLV